MVRFKARALLTLLLLPPIAGVAFAQSAPAQLQSCARIMPLGDSITVGANGGYRNDLYTGLQLNNCGVSYVGTQYDDNTKVEDKHHEGHPYFSIRDIANGVDGWLAATGPDIITLLIGTNDVSAFAAETAEQIGVRHDALIDQIRAARPNAWIFVASLPPETSLVIPPNNVDRALLVGQFNAVIRKNTDARAQTGQRVRFVDVNSVLTVGDLYDGIHPTEAAYAKVAAKFLEVIRVALDPSSPLPPPAPTPTPSPPPPADAPMNPMPMSPPTGNAASPPTHRGGGALALPLLISLLALLRLSALVRQRFE